LIAIESDLEALGSTFQHTIDSDALLREFLARHPNVFTVTVIDLSGDILIQRQRMGAISATTITEQPWLDFDEPYWGEVSPRDDGFPFVDVAVPIWDKIPGELGYSRNRTLLAEVDLTSFWDVVRGVRIGNGGYAYVIDQNGQLLAHRDISLVRGGATTQDTLGQSADDLVANSSNLLTSVHQGVNGERVISSAQVLMTIPLVVVTEWAIPDILRQLVVLGIIILLLGATVVWVVASLIGFTRKRITTPLSTLRGSVEAFQQGDMKQRIVQQNPRGDEIDLLIGTFNEMADSITDRTRDLIIANKQAEEASRLKTEFLSMVSHELRTPLNAIMGYSGLLLEGLSGKIDEKAHQMVNRIDLNSQRLLSLINDLLDLSGIETGSITISNLTFDPHKLADQWDKQYRVLAENAGLAFDIQVDPQLPQTLYGDPNRITQVVANLISNACKFTEEGSVTLKVDYDVIEWRLTVTDTGIGIQDDALQFIFERFRQVDGSATRLYGGTGLGLTIVEQLVHLMGGRVTVESEYGEGSSFTVSLPAVTRPQDIGRLYPPAKAR
jgi:signal transduction histidine kinase